MSFAPVTLLAILGMALATYACRGGGYWLFSQFKPTPLLRSWLAYVPGTLFVSFVVPALVDGGVQTTVGAAATLATMLATRNLAFAVVAGTGAAWVVWAFR